MDPLPGQKPEAPLPIKITSELEWEVEEILAVKKTGKKLSYRAKWLNFDEDPEWYPASDFKYALHLL